MVLLLHRILLLHNVFVPGRLGGLCLNGSASKVKRECTDSQQESRAEMVWLGVWMGLCEMRAYAQVQKRRGCTTSWVLVLTLVLGFCLANAATWTWRDRAAKALLGTRRCMGLETGRRRCEDIEGTPMKEGVTRRSMGEQIDPASWRRVDN